MTSSSRNASPSTNANTQKMRDSIRELKSSVPAVMPVTSALAPSTDPIVAGMIRRAGRPAPRSSDRRVPSPAIGSCTDATVPSSDVLIVAGSAKPPLATASRRMSAIAARISGERTLSASTATTAGIGLPGNASWMRS